MALVLFENRAGFRQLEAVRRILRADGMEFCDEDDWTEEETQSFTISRALGQDVRQRVNLEASACSSADNTEQVCFSSPPLLTP